MSDQMDALIKEINALAHKSKTEELSPEEKQDKKNSERNILKSLEKGCVSS